MRQPNEKFAETEVALQAALRRCANKDRAAFKIIYDLTATKFLAITTRMVGSNTLAQDILQRAYLSIWSNAASYDPEKGKAFTWMLVVLRNRSVDTLRANARHNPAEHLEEVMEDVNARPTESAEAALLQRLIGPEMDALPEHVATAIRMHVVEGWTSREIGQHFDVPTHTAKSWIRRGLRRMRQNLPANTVNDLL